MLQAAIHDRKQVGQNAFEITFEVATEINFTAGQYVEIWLSHLASDSKGPGRQFSICSSPNNKNLLSIVFRLSDSPFKQFLATAPLGTKVEISGPFGNFVLPKDHSRPVVLIAGGTGISPFISMLRFAAEEKLPHKLHLLYASENPEKIVYLDELEKLKQQNPNFTMKLYAGHIDEGLLDHNLVQLSQSRWYISGPPAMVEIADEILLKRGIAAEDIYFEESNLTLFIKTLNRLAIFDKSSDGILIADLRGIIKYVNPAWQKLSGWSAGEVIDKTTPRILKFDHDKSYYEHLWQTILDGKVFREELTNKRKDGTLYDTDEIIFAIRNASGGIVGFNAFQRDITERKKIEREVAAGRINMVTIEQEQNAIFNILEDMQIDKIAIEDQHIATFNILEDVNQAQDELLLANRSLERRKFELQALKSLSDELTGTLDLRTAIDSVNKYLWEVLDYSLATYMVYDPSTGGFEFRANLKESVSEEFLLKARTELANYISAKADPVMVGAAEEIAAKKGDLTASLSGQPLIDTGKSNFNSSFILPLSVGEKILGALHISSTKPNLYQKPGEREIVVAMVATVSVSISRLQILLLSQHSRTESLIESLSNGVIMFDAQKKVILANPVAVTFTGLPKEGYALDELYKLFSGLKLDEIVSQMLAGGKTAKIDKANLVNYVFEIVTTPVRDFKANIIGGAIIFHDITHITEVDRMKTEFLSVAAHQLRTPLGSMRWNLEMLLGGDYGDVPDGNKEAIKQIYDSNIRLITLVNDLLNVSRIDQGKVTDEPKLTDVIKIIKDTVKEMQQIADKKSVAISILLEKDNIPKVMLDPKRLREVIENLLSNAVKYNLEGGRVVVEIRKLDEHIEIKVKDTGMGIPPEDQAKVYSKFFRAANAVRSETEGTGLGLFVVKSYTEKWGGKVSFESTLGKGTTFKVTLPLNLLKK